MRIVDADELKQVVESELAGDGYGIRRFTEIIDNAPAVEAVHLDLHEKILDQTVRELFKCQEELEKVRNEKRPQGERCRMNNIYVLLDQMRSSIISMDLSYSQTIELLDQILKIEKAVDSEEKPHGEWIDCSEDYGYVECPVCGHLTTCDDNKDELHYCWYCGSKMGKGSAE